MVEQAGRCISCGSHQWEWDDYEADTWTCKGCEMIEMRGALARDKPGEAFGRKVRLYRKDRDG